MRPIVEEYPFPVTPEQVFDRLSGENHPFFLDSALKDARQGRYSAGEPCA
jgi:hypothetical protein